jgi:lipoyl(octanoyl) transferase
MTEASPSPSQSSPPLEVFMLGLVDFDDAQRLQRRLVYDLGERPGAALILCEHPPTISVGRSGSRAHIRADDAELRAMNIPVRWVNRGGGCVLHLPGQVVGYLALSLPSFGLDVARYLSGVYRVLVDVLAEFDLNGSTRDEAPGVFLGPSRVASVGVAVGRWIAYHGFSLNVGSYLEPFRLLDEPAPAPGLPSIRMTSMEAWRQRPTPMAKVRESLIRRVEQNFGLERNHVYTAHPLIRRKVRDDVYAPSYQ